MEKGVRMGIAKLLFLHGNQDCLLEGKHYSSYLIKKEGDTLADAFLSVHPAAVVLDSVKEWDVSIFSTGVTMDKLWLLGNIASYLNYYSDMTWNIGLNYEYYALSFIFTGFAIHNGAVLSRNVASSYFDIHRTNQSGFWMALQEVLMRMQRELGSIVTGIDLNELYEDSRVLLKDFPTPFGRC